MSDLPVRIRDARDSDFGFILDTWRRSFEGAPAVVDADPNHLFGELAIMIGRALKRAGAIVRVACDPEDDDVLLGFVACNGSELHYAYVKRDLRNHGIVPAMLDGLEIRSYTFRTPAGDRRFRPRARGWLYTPRFTL